MMPVLWAAGKPTPGRRPPPPLIRSLPPNPSKFSTVPDGLLLPMNVSLKNEPRTLLTPVKVSVPTEESPVAMPDAPLLGVAQLVTGLKITVTPAVAWKYEIRVWPLPVMVSLPVQRSCWLDGPNASEWVLRMKLKVQGFTNDSMTRPPFALSMTAFIQRAAKTLRSKFAS